MASQWRSRLSVKAVSASDYPSIIAADRAVYPTPNGLTKPVLSRWFGKQREFGIFFLDQATGRQVANCIVVALTECGWQLLTEGKVSESELDGDLLFDASRDDTIGIHVYHLEKSRTEYPKDIPRFGMVALDAISDVLGALRRARPPGRRPLSVCGFSGLTVTRLGCSLFANLYGCRERRYVCKEHLLLNEEGQLEVHEAETQEELQRLLQPAAASGRGRTYVLRARMLVVTPDEPSLVWSAILPRV